MSAVVALPAVDIRRLSADMSAGIRDGLTDSQLLNVRNGDAVPGDYIDETEVMAEALALQLPYESLADYGDAVADAWQRACESGFTLSRILFACEYSATCRDAFAAQGHSVLSADLEPCDAPGPHYQGDVRDVLYDGWHMMLAFPPCTYLCNSGVKHLVRGGKRINPERWELMHEAAEFFRDLGDAPIERICRENPVIHKYAAEIIGSRADQFVQPYEFGEDVSKRTGLHLKNLPKLIKRAADYVQPRLIEYRGKIVKRWANQSPCGADSAAPSDDRGHKRSKFHVGLANAMAAQWGAA